MYESGVPLCNDCACTTSTKLTQKKNGVEYERYDVLDRDNSDGGDAIAPNPYPVPCDLFEFTFDRRVRVIYAVTVEEVQISQFRYLGQS